MTPQITSSPDTDCPNSNGDHIRQEVDAALRGEVRQILDETEEGKSFEVLFNELLKWCGEGRGKGKSMIAKGNIYSYVARDIFFFFGPSRGRTAESPRRPARAQSERSDGEPSTRRARN
jgi:hypothetical protein